jgi:hypothetical protein
MQTRLPQACRWVSIAVLYLPLQRHRISPSSRQSPGKNLPGRIPLHHPMVTSDSGLFLLRLSSHLLFLHFISRPINCILFSISNNPIPFIDVPGLEKGGCVVFLSFWTGPGLKSHRGLVCNAVRRMTLRGLLTRVHETCDWTSRAGFWKDHPKV